MHEVSVWKMVEHQYRVASSVLIGCDQYSWLSTKINATTKKKKEEK